MPLSTYRMRRGRIPCPLPEQGVDMEKSAGFHAFPPKVNSSKVCPVDHQGKYAKHQFFTLVWPIEHITRNERKKGSGGFFSYKSRPCKHVGQNGCFSLWGFFGFEISRSPDFQPAPPAPEEFSDPNLISLPTHPGIKSIARSRFCDHGSLRNTIAVDVAALISVFNARLRGLSWWCKLGPKRSSSIS